MCPAKLLMRLQMFGAMYTQAGALSCLCVCVCVCAPLQDVDEAELSIEEAKQRKIMKLLLKVKNGTPPQRKAALRQLTDKARDFGAGPLFDQILPLRVSDRHGTHSHT